MDSIDKFGRHLKKRPLTSTVATVERVNLLELNSDGDYDFKNKRLCNVQVPLKDFDAANMKYVNTVLKEMDNSQLKLRMNKFEIQLKKLESQLKKSVTDHSARIKNLSNSSSNIGQQIVDIKYHLDNLKTEVASLHRKLPPVAEQGNEQNQARPRQRTSQTG